MRYGYSYATIRAVPRVERGEFVNIGVIVYCHKEIPPSDEFRQFIQRSPTDRRGA